MAYRECRIKAGFKQRHVAKELGVTPPTVCAWEKGTAEPKADNLRKLALLYGCTVDALMKGEGTKK